MQRNEVIDLYLSMLKKWNKKINLVQENTMLNAFERHIKDSVQIIDMLHVEDFIIDIGSGAGLPGAILSIYGFKNIALCEKNFKKAVFLQEVKSKLNLNYEIFNDDIYNFPKVEIVPRGAFQNLVVVSRAFGSLSKLLDVMCFLEADKGVFHKGENYIEELSSSHEIFDFKYETNQSMTNSKSVIITVCEVRRK